MNATLLFAAARSEDVTVIDQAVHASEISIEKLVNDEGDGLAQVAVRKGHLQFLKRLVAAGVDVQLPNRKGRCLVHEASQNAQLHVLKYLHSIHADFTVLTNEGDSVLDMAKNSEIEAYLETVLGVGGRVDRGTSRGKKTGKKKKKRQGKLSELQEIPKLDQIVPNEMPITRTERLSESEAGCVTICDLDEVGWGEGEVLDFPRRPDWRGMGLDSAKALHAVEEERFSQWLKKMDATEGVGTFERNLEYWRELWRVMERGDIYIILADARHPLLHLHKGFLNYLRNEMQRPVLVCLSKSDLLQHQPMLLETWIDYLVSEMSVEVISISCKDEGRSRCDLIRKILDLRPFQQREPTSEISSKTVEELVGLDVESILQFRDLKNQRRKKLSKKAKARLEKEQQQHEVFEDEAGSVYSASDEDHESLTDVQRTVVVSVIGEPNVGKSSVINALLGIKKVAVSAHPGRTKHLQTHFLSPHLLLCDCPGLVFPKKHVPFPMQVLFGGFPIARCRDVYSVVEFLAQHIQPDLPTLLNLTLLEEDREEHREWSVLNICESLAAKNKWTTHRGGRWDVYRSANSILRSALAGREGVILAFGPPS